jgi:ABC-2 type transport system ATP-binding protein
MLRPDHGTVSIAGRSLEHADWSAVGHLVDYPLAYRELTCRQNLALGARLHGVVPTAIPRMVGTAIEVLHLGQYAERRAGKLSLGNKQRLGLASALQHDPSFIVLDEPTNTLDPAGVILLREALLRRSAGGAAVFVSSHHLDEVARVADRISVLNAGRIIGSLDPHGIDIERAFFDLVHSDDLASITGLVTEFTKLTRATVVRVASVLIVLGISLICRRCCSPYTPTTPSSPRNSVRCLPTSRRGWAASSPCPCSASRSPHLRPGQQPSADRCSPASLSPSSSWSPLRCP